MVTWIKGDLLPNTKTQRIIILFSSILCASIGYFNVVAIWFPTTNERDGQGMGEQYVCMCAGAYMSGLHPALTQRPSPIYCASPLINPLLISHFKQGYDNMGGNNMYDRSPLTFWRNQQSSWQDSELHSVTTQIIHFISAPTLMSNTLASYLWVDMSNGNSEAICIVGS
jgi:hypothetical protein